VVLFIAGTFRDANTTRGSCRSRGWRSWGWRMCRRDGATGSESKCPLFRGRPQQRCDLSGSSPRWGLSRIVHTVLGAKSVGKHRLGIK
jgi:hypothetical protein